jgi:hypothetical protein
MYSVACLAADFLQSPLRSDFERVSLLSLSYGVRVANILLSRETQSYECTPAKRILHSEHFVSNHLILLHKFLCSW